MSKRLTANVRKSIIQSQTLSANEIFIYKKYKRPIMQTFTPQKKHKFRFWGSKVGST